MERSIASARVLRLDEVPPIEVAGGLYQPLRRTLGVRAFAINSYVARTAGAQVIERHDEEGAGSGHHEEVYIVVSGHARFTVDEDDVDAPAGTVVFVPSIAATRSAVAVAGDTTVIVVGGPAAQPLPVSPFEYWFVAEAPYRAGEYQAAIDVLSEGLKQWPDHPVIHYNLACYHALAGHSDAALDHLDRAVTADSELKGFAATDSDLDAVRDDPRFPTPTE